MPSESTPKQEKKCECFTCRNSGNPELLEAYYTGQVEALKPVLESLKRNGIKKGRVEDQNLEGLLACVDYEYNACGTYLEEVKNRIKFSKIKFDIPFLALYKTKDQGRNLCQVLVKKKDENGGYNYYGFSDSNTFYKKGIEDLLEDYVYLDTILAIVKKLKEKQNDSNS